MSGGTSKKPRGTPGHAGHRKRLRERFLKGGADALADYELLELLLFLANPRQDMKPLAKALLQRFGSFADVISADPADLAEIKGTGAGLIVTLKTVQAAAAEFLKGQVMDRPVLGNWDQLIDYCRAVMAFGKTERFRVLYLNQKNALIADEEQQQGTVNHTPVYPREVVKRALEVGATAIIMVHNHPSGDAEPSRADIDMTKEVRDACEKLDITLHDHVIVTKGSFSSFKSKGLL